MESFQYLVEIWGTFVPVRYSGFGIRDSINVFGIRSISRFKRFPGYVKAKKNTKENMERRLLLQPIIFSTDKDLTYPKC